MATRAPHTTRRARRARTAAVVVLSLAGAAVATAPAQAASGTAGEGARAGSDGARHCILDLSSGEQNCFANFTRAVETATDGRITDAPASAGSAARDRGFRAETKQLAASSQAALQGDVIQGTFFEHDGYAGASLTVYGTAPCEKDGWVDFQLDLADEWKNVISSVQPWANCWIWLYPETGLNGDRDGPFKENTADIGSFMNDRTQSIGFS